MMNSQFMVTRAKALAQRLRSDADDDPARIKLAYDLLFSRQVTQRELEIGQAFLRAAGEERENVKLTPWQQYAQVLLSANEFLYVQ